MAKTAKGKLTEEVLSMEEIWDATTPTIEKNRKKYNRKQKYKKTKYDYLNDED